MKKNSLLLCSLIILFSCSKDDTPDDSSLQLRAAATNALLDASREVEVVIVENSAKGYHNSVSVEVPADYVVVGGGASISLSDPSGALLTGSYPDMSLTKWNATSKDHLKKQHHQLTVYAIGLKLKGVSKSTLRNNMTVLKASKLTTQAQLANISIDLPQEYLIVGGGAQITLKVGDGVLLRGSHQGYWESPVTGFHMENRWQAYARDHTNFSTADLTVYAIGIKKNIPGFGELQTYNRVTRYSLYGYAGGKFTLSKDITSGYVPTCVGAATSSYGQGRMLYSLKPTFHYVSVTDTDHQIYDTTGTIYLVPNLIRKKQ